MAVILRLALGWENYRIGIARGTVDSELLRRTIEECLLIMGGSGRRWSVPGRTMVGHVLGVL